MSSIPNRTSEDSAWQASCATSDKRRFSVGTLPPTRPRFPEPIVVSGAEDPGVVDLAIRAAETSPMPDFPSGCSVQGHHLRAARGMLGWPLHRLADTSQLSVSTLRRLEGITTEASQPSRFRAAVALHAGGVRFILIDGCVVGVALFSDLNAARLRP